MQCGRLPRDRGWDPDSKDPVVPMQTDGAAYYESRPCWTRDGDGWRPGERRVRALPPEDHADAAEDDESLSMTGGWADHRHPRALRVGEEVERIAAEIAPDKAGLLHLAGRWARSRQGACRVSEFHSGRWPPLNETTSPRRRRTSLGRAGTHNMYRIGPGDRRRGFRHELASTLGLFGVLQRHEPQHQGAARPMARVVRRHWGGGQGRPSRGRHGPHRADRR